MRSWTWSLKIIVHKSEAGHIHTVWHFFAFFPISVQKLPWTLLHVLADMLSKVAMLSGFCVYEFWDRKIANLTENRNLWVLKVCEVMIFSHVVCAWPSLKQKSYQIVILQLKDSSLFRNSITRAKCISPIILLSPAAFLLHQDSCQEAMYTFTFIDP